MDRLNAHMRRLYYLGIFVPAALAAHLAHAPAIAVFVASAIGVVPAAALMGDATEQLAEHSGPGVAGLLNVTLGNLPELIIALFALDKGLQEVVKASLVGSVIGNALLVLGASMLVGGWKRANQRFSATAAQTQSGMLFIAVCALILPAVFQLVHGGHLPALGGLRYPSGHALQHLSIGVAVAMIAVYLAGLFFSLRTHRDVFNPRQRSAGEEPKWSIRYSVLMLAIAAVLVAITSDTLVDSIEHASHQIGLSQFFVAAFVIGIAGNAAEHYVAVLAAARDQMDLSLNIAVGSSSQVGLFVAPVLVLMSFAIGPSPMALLFNGYELAALLLSALAVSALTADGESTWFKGAQLLALYGLLGLVFFFA